MSHAERHEPEQESKPERYSLERLSIEALTEPRKMSGKMATFPWPLELQGKGVSNEKDKSMLIRFPSGDIFLSYVTTIHELGHIRQEELKPELKANTQTHETLLAQEIDAWDRGWKRFLTANSTLSSSLERKLEQYHASGKIGFSSFQELYGWVRQNVLRMVEAQRVLFEESGEPDEEKMDRLADEFERIGVHDFLEQYQKTRVGEMVDEQEMQTAIQKTIELAIEEQGGSIRT